MHIFKRIDIFGWGGVSSSLSASSSTSFGDSSHHKNGHITSLICAIASPLTYAVANTVDKIVISKRVHCTAGYTPYVGIIDIIIGICVGCAGDWSKSTLKKLNALDFIFPLLSGICLGVGSALYFFALEWAEVSRVIGLESIYPLFVTLWSYIFLDDTIESIGYVGIFFATFGGVVMSFDAIRILFIAVISNVERFSGFKKAYFKKEERKKAEAKSSNIEGDNYGACWVFCRIYGVPYRVKKARKEKNAEYTKALLDSTLDVVNVEEDNDVPEPASDNETIEDSSVHKLTMVVDEEKDAGGNDKMAEKKKKKKKKNIRKKKNDAEMVKNVLMLIPIPIVMSGNDFFAKVSVSGMPVNNVSALNSIGFGSVLVLFIISKKGRKHFLDEVKYNWFYGIISEFLTILSTYLVIVGMTGLSAPIVSALSSLRPFFLLISETALRISTDSVYQCIGFKLFPILFIVAGVILITFSVVSD